MECTCVVRAGPLVTENAEIPETLPFRMDCCERNCFRALVCDSQPFLRGAPKGTTQHTSTLNPSCFSDLKQIFLLCHSLPT